MQGEREPFSLLCARSFLRPLLPRAGYDYARDSLETKKLCCYHKFGQPMKIADILQPHHWFWKNSPQNDILGMSAEISYWWQVTTQIWVVLLIGFAARKICYNQSEALPIWLVISMEFWQLFLRGYFAGKPVLVSRNESENWAMTLMTFVKETWVWMALEKCRNRFFTHNFLPSKPLFLWKVQARAS